MMIIEDLYHIKIQEVVLGIVNTMVKEIYVIIGIILDIKKIIDIMLITL